MAFVDVAAHKITKPGPDSTCTTTIGSASLKQSGTMEESLREMKLAYIKRIAKIHGQFSDIPGDNQFSQLLNEVLKEKLSFITFTKNCISHLKVKLESSPAYIDGYLFFAREKLAHEQSLWVFVAHHKQGHYLDENLQLSETRILDIEGISLAVKVNISDWQNDDKRSSYLSVLTNRGEKDINEAFLQWLGFANKANVKEQTDAFISVMEDFTANQPAPIAQETREKALNYCIEQEKLGERVKLQSLAEEISSGNETQFIELVKQKQPAISEEIIPNRNQLRQYLRISGRDEKFSMSFNANCLGDTIEYDLDRQSLLIKNLPKSLQQRISNHLKQHTEKDPQE